MDRRARVAATAALVSLAAPLGASATAQAAEIAVPACSPFLEGERTVNVQGAGFAPNSPVTLKVGDQKLGEVRSDASGAFRAEAFGPEFSSVRRNLQTFDLLAEDAEGTSATASLRMTRINATLPARARPGSRVSYRVYGFAPGADVYVHVRRGGKTLGSYEIGEAAAPCGTATRKLKYMPIAGYKAGTYVYWFQTSKTFDSKAISVRLPVQIVRREP